MNNESWKALFSEEFSSLYELHNFNNAAEILSFSYKKEFQEIVETLLHFKISPNDLIQGGGSESAIPKKFSAFLRPLGWDEIKITGDLLVKLHKRNSKETTEELIKDYIDGHNMDYVKNKIAIDLEWNSKDQTFDRDLYAFRTFYECGVISCGVLITRSEELNSLFKDLGIWKKYGASTTWMGKLLPRLRSRRHGGCPLLVVGITSRVCGEGLK